MFARLTLPLLLLICSCNPRVTHSNTAVFSTVDALLRNDTSRTGFFTNSSLFDTAYHFIAYETTRGRVTVPNDGTQNFFLCRYDTATLQPVWIAVAWGTGGDGGCNYHSVPPEGAVYVLGAFEDTAYFPHQAGLPECDTLVSRGFADLFVAKYDYDTGKLLWIVSGGSPYSDVVYMLGGKRHQETFMTVDSGAVTIYTNCFGPVRIGGTSIDCKLSGEAVWMRFDKATGEVLGIGHPTALPMTDQQ